MAAATTRNSEGYYHCYLLHSLASARSTASYVGFTTHPMRRIRQHNGEIKGGAKHTRRHRPWEMACVVGGFSSKVTALQFEWAWQHPRKSRRVREGAPPGTVGKSGFRGRAATMLAMLRIRPWSSMPLTLQIASDAAHAVIAPLLRAGPLACHITCSRGPLNELAVYEQQQQVDAAAAVGVESSSSSSAAAAAAALCTLCAEACCEGEGEDASAGGRWAGCPRCGGGGRAVTRVHLRCLARAFLSAADASSGASLLIPVRGRFPHCRCDVAWAEVVATWRTRQRRQAVARRKAAQKGRRRRTGRPAAAAAAAASGSGGEDGGSSARAFTLTFCLSDADDEEEEAAEDERSFGGETLDLTACLYDDDEEEEEGDGDAKAATHSSSEAEGSVMFDDDFDGFDDDDDFDVNFDNDNDDDDGEDGFYGGIEGVQMMMSEESGGGDDAHDVDAEEEEGEEVGGGEVRRRGDGAALVVADDAAVATLEARFDVIDLT